jgi:hypothetical protein
MIRVLAPVLLAAGLVAVVHAAESTQYVSVSAAFVAPKTTGADGAIAVSFTPKEPQVVVNENPGPRLKLDAAQTVLVDKQPPRSASAPPPDPSKGEYLKPGVPVHFPVAIAAGAPRGTHAVKATVTFFFCSKREAWCRKGTTDVTVQVAVP